MSSQDLELNRYLKSHELSFQKLKKRTSLAKASSGFLKLQYHKVTLMKYFAKRDMTFASKGRALLS